MVTLKKMRYYNIFRMKYCTAKLYLEKEKKSLQSPGGRQGSSSSEGSSDGPNDSSCQTSKQQTIS